jgi:5-carboxymethyl-2-hydroxymuconate isomerase
MPQICLEYTSNITLPLEYNQFFKRLHDLLVASVVGVELNACKSRVRPLQHFYIADGKERNAFVHLSIGLLSGRTLAEKAALSQTALQLLKDFYQPVFDLFALQLTVAVEDMTRETYSKFAS